MSPFQLFRIIIFRFFLHTMSMQGKVIAFVSTVHIFETLCIHKNCHKFCYTFRPVKTSYWYTATRNLINSLQSGFRLQIKDPISKNEGGPRVERRCLQTHFHELEISIISFVFCYYLKICLSKDFYSNTRE